MQINVTRGPGDAAVIQMLMAGSRCGPALTHEAALLYPESSMYEVLLSL